MKDSDCDWTRQATERWWVSTWGSDKQALYRDLHEWRRYRASLRWCAGRLLLWRETPAGREVAMVNLDLMRWVRIKAGTLRLAYRMANKVAGGEHAACWMDLPEVPYPGADKSVHLVLS
jgi:hypothetical protein